MATTAEQLLEALTAAAKKSAEEGIAAFREGEDSAQLHSLKDFAALIRTLADDEVAASINGAGETPRPKFRSLV
jgi:hypothetical protein